MGDGGRDIMVNGLELLNRRYAFLELVLRVLNSDDIDYQLLHSIYNVVNHRGVHVPNVELLSALWQVDTNGGGK